MAVIVYSTETCPWCTRAKDFLVEHKVNFKEKDVSKDYNAAKEMVRKSGQKGVPVFDINGKIFAGYDEEKLKELLGLK